jgi:hypothetical protein
MQRPSDTSPDIRQMLIERDRIRAALRQSPDPELRRELKSISSRIQRTTRAQAHEEFRRTMPRLTHDSRLQWTHGRSLQGLPLAGRAHCGDLVFNYSTADNGDGTAALSVFVHYRHPVGQLASGRDSMDVDDDIDDRLEVLVGDLARAWLERG